MLPLSLLNAAQNKPMLVELKNGETFNGHLVNCDNFMNITLREVYQTSAEGDRFWKLKECYIRGSTPWNLLCIDAFVLADGTSHAMEIGSSTYEYQTPFWTPSRKNNTVQGKRVGVHVVLMLAVRVLEDGARLLEVAEPYVVAQSAARVEGEGECKAHDGSTVLSSYIRVFCFRV
ncbi:hypothetical protein ONZ51_g2473 [Trametes cubensis]|uniref:LSM complex subunit LSM4 n=1 Tax=Trametes cubensis TaxID=1111947 RepID=A0AAD7XEG1_9APHY|nr:hypothetical protein ONZ51_g2473 [Trametes cubensis]